MIETRSLHFSPSCGSHLDNMIRSMTLEGWTLLATFQEYLIFSRELPPGVQPSGRGRRKPTETAVQEKLI